MLEQQLVGHKDAIHALAFEGGDQNRGVEIIASSAADSTIIIWKRNNENGRNDL